MDTSKGIAVVDLGGPPGSHRIIRQIQGPQGHEKIFSRPAPLFILGTEWAGPPLTSRSEFATGSWVSIAPKTYWFGRFLVRLINYIELTQLRTIGKKHISAKHQNPLLLLKVLSHKFILIVHFPSSIRCIVTDMDTFCCRREGFCWRISIIFAL